MISIIKVNGYTYFLKGLLKTGKLYMYVFRGRFSIVNITLALIAVAFTMLALNLTVGDIRSSPFFIIALILVSLFALYEIAVVIYLLSIYLVIDEKGLILGKLFGKARLEWDNIVDVEEKMIKFKVLHKTYLSHYYKLLISFKNPLTEALHKIKISQEFFEDYNRILELIQKRYPFEPCKRSGIFG
jgi:hypothetical protein